MMALHSDDLPGPSRFFGSRVTARRLHPQLNELLQERLKERPKTIQRTLVPDKLIAALREHVFNNMPLRLILLPEMKLIERNDIVNHILANMTAVDNSLLDEMDRKITSLGRMDYPTDPNDQDEDAREDPWKAICQFLFQKFALFCILSHTWLPANEIIYQHTFQQGWLEKDGPGLAKLKGFCDVTHRNHHITLAWIDTLCINKESSAELDESIQSMYKWYQNSSICITYLGNTNTLSDMPKDPWFTRGWTLQELIAPKTMYFYSRNWIRLISDVYSDKANSKIQTIISRVTKIGAEELVSFDPLTGSDIPTRMHWAASRNTTRGEDRAYSLMGIFGVHFSISYGEGAERAFFRLIEAIISSRHTSHIIQALHWAGRSVSDTIHPSRLIPSGPECYVRKDTTHNFPNINIANMFPILMEPMVLTHLGLRVRLLLVQPDNIGFHAEQAHAPFIIEVRSILDNFVIAYPRFRLEKLFSINPTRESILPFYNPQLPIKCRSNFFFGIYTFNEDEDQDCVHIPTAAYAFFLGIRTPKLNFSIRDVSTKHFEPTAKLDTREIIRIIPSDNRPPTDPKRSDSIQGIITFNKEYLEKIGVKVVNVFL